MAPRSRLAAVAGLAVLLAAPGLVNAQEADGFDGYIQSGTCAEPSNDVRVNLDSDASHDVEPYLAQPAGGGEPTVLGYYGSPGAPGFGLSAIYTDQEFSLIITDTETGDPVACGDILEPEADAFGEAGLALVQLLPVEGSEIQGIAAIQRARLQRELDVTPTRVRILLSEGVAVPATDQLAAGYEGYVQGGSCEAPADTGIRVELKSREDHDVIPYLAKPDGGAEPVTLAYYGAAGAPGFGLAAAYTDQNFSLVITDIDTDDSVACGDILKPDADEFTEAGMALVELLPVGDSGVPGYALVERVALQRELDVTPTRVRVLLFAPPATSQ
jgi:hypothetical protein